MDSSSRARRIGLPACNPSPSKNRQHADFRSRRRSLSRGACWQKLPVLDREPDMPPGDVLNVIYAAPTDEMTRAVAFAGMDIAVGQPFCCCITVALAVWGLRRRLASAGGAGRPALLRFRPSNWELNPSDAARDTTGTGAADAGDDDDARRTASRLHPAARVSGQCRARAEDAGRDFEIDIAIAAAAAASGRRVSRRAGSRRWTTWRGWRSCCTRCCGWHAPSSGQPAAHGAIWRSSTSLPFARVRSTAWHRSRANAMLPWTSSRQWRHAGARRCRRPGAGLGEPAGERDPLQPAGGTRAISPARQRQAAA